MVYQPEITKSYSLNDWRDDIKKILREAGGMGRDAVFLLSEGSIKEEHYLQDIDCLLNSGEVPNMYAMDEKQELMDMVRLAAQGKLYFDIVIIIILCLYLTSILMID